MPVFKREDKKTRREFGRTEYSIRNLTGGIMESFVQTQTMAEMINY